MSHTFLKTAGIQKETGGITSDHILRQDLYFQPRTQTPEKDKKFRKSTKEVPGVRQIHYGIYNDPRDYENYIHGVKTSDSEHVNDCIKSANLSGVHQFLNKIKEDKYLKNKKEPLGKVMNRNYEFPENIDENFKFGVQTAGIHSAKEIIYNKDIKLVESEETKNLYYKSHGITDPGEQNNRNYNWPLDKNNHVFGKADVKEVDGTKKSLAFDSLSANYPRTVINKKSAEDFRQATNDMLGKGKFRGTLGSHVINNAEHAYGKKSVLGKNWNVAKCIHGEGIGNGNGNSFGNCNNNSRYFEPDADLGKSMTHKSKLASSQAIVNNVKEIDPGVVFGTPSVKKGKGNENKDDKDVFDLLYPNPHVVRGVDDPDFETLIEKEKVIFIKNLHYLPIVERNSKKKKL